MTSIRYCLGVGEHGVWRQHVQTMFVHLEGIARCLTEFSIITVIPFADTPDAPLDVPSFLGRWMWFDRNRPMCFGKTSIPQRKRFEATRGQRWEEILEHVTAVRVQSCAAISFQFKGLIGFIQVDPSSENPQLAKDRFQNLRFEIESVKPKS